MPGQLFIVAAPSGAGKTSLVRSLLVDQPQLLLSVSYTTRAARPGEKHAEHYYFVSLNEFENMLSENVFVEHALVFGHYYGTSALWLSRQLHPGKDVLLEIDWQGARQVRQHFKDAIGIFILPPSQQALEQRLRARKQDSSEVIAKRMAQAVVEMSHYAEFDYVIINDEFTQALDELTHIILSAPLKTANVQLNKADLLKKLLAMS